MSIASAKFYVVIGGLYPSDDEDFHWMGFADSERTAIRTWVAKAWESKHATVEEMQAATEAGDVPRARRIYVSDTPIKRAM